MQSLNWVEKEFKEHNGCQWCFAMHFTLNPRNLIQKTRRFIRYTDENGLYWKGPSTNKEIGKVNSCFCYEHANIKKMVVTEDCSYDMGYADKEGRMAMLTH
jgi:hypothetical protein